MHNPWNHFLETAIPIPYTPHPLGTYVSAKALKTQIYATLHFWGIFSNIHAGEFQRERCILGTVLAKFSFAFVFTSPLGHGRGFSWWREIVPHKTCPAGRLNFVSRESEENCKLRQTFLLFAQFAPSHLFNTPHLLFKWLDCTQK